MSKGYYFHTPFPQFILQQAHIMTHLELLAFIVALKAWPHLISNTKFMASLDDMVEVFAINTGHSKDPFINADLQEIAFLSALHNFEVQAHHIPEVTNTIPDLLSHWDLGDAAHQQFHTLNQDNHFTGPLSMPNGFSLSMSGNFPSTTVCTNYPCLPFYLIFLLLFLYFQFMTGLD